jgi:hypothetical protein
MEKEVDSVTEALFCLEEPWRGRFLILLANLATKWAWNGRLPEREDVAGWLRTNRDLRQQVRMLLDTWQGKRI